MVGENSRKRRNQVRAVSQSHRPIYNIPRSDDDEPRRPRKTVTAKKLNEQKRRTVRFSEWRERRRSLRAKPKLRGWLHLVAFPFSIATSVILICLAPAGWMKVGISVYGATIMLLFGNSAALHLGHGHFPKRVDDVLCRIDYSNIFLVIAGTCTPFLFALNNKPLCWTYMGILWVTAAVGTIVHLLYPVGLDWLFTIVYIILGLAPITIIYFFWTSPFIGPVPTILVICGGACYIAGAVCFALRKPNPFPRWFGYHELFHLGTIGGYVCHVIALFVVVLQMR
ncbi:PAQR family membrane homeostasis protein TrhA [Bifidobacterium italicum]|uniref:PAQR family membrane homeostasis protein TrhA n=1 Tax=Bifidobacterium italicum TaxID=1960968 RepID=UPI000BABDE8A|nr:hemolysin III family protein [Bifidobacterium italicum]